MAEVQTYGMVAEFDDPEELVAAARAVRDKGYRRFETYTPYAIRELDEIVPQDDWIPLLVLLSGALGTITAFGLQYWIAAIHYPLNIGGRPLNSWPSWVPIMFELTVLFAASAAFFGMLFFAGFPALYHPMFRIPTFERASDDGFFLCIEARDALFESDATARFLLSFDPLKVWEVDDE
jgi:hypothetical protein